MTKDEIVDIFENIARLLELKGENPFKVRAYTNAARALETSVDDLAALVESGEIAEVEGLGKATAEKVTTLVRTGQLEYYDKLREEFPPDIFTLFEVPGLGAKKIKVLYETLKVHSLTKLERVCRSGAVAELPGFGEKTAQNILQGLEQLKKSAGQFRFGDIASIAEEILADLRSHPEITLVQIAGSYRRRKPIVRDLDFIASTREPKLVSEDFAHHPLVERVIAQGDTKTSVVLNNGLQCDLRVVTSAEYPFALNYFTGSKEHNVRMRSRALARGWSLNEYRFSQAEGRELKEPLPTVRTEADIYEALGLAYIEPELREDAGEFDAAEHREIPVLIDWPNLRGTFHCHTTESDGRASLEDMAAAAQELGLEYLGLADHSVSSVQAHGLDADRLLAQVAKIRAFNKTAEDFRLFAGVECDIRKDGSLDYPDEVLAQLDYVVASVHGSFTLSEAEMTDRIIKAISNKYVTMLGHITGRLLLTREPYKVNIPSVIEAAAATDTIIEINANPRRLEMDWRWWPLAKSKGVRCAINPDAHSTAGLQDLIFGVGIARKGWLTRKDVINTLSAAKIEAELFRKRNR